MYGWYREPAMPERPWSWYEARYEDEMDRKLEEESD